MLTIRHKNFFFNFPQNLAGNFFLFRKNLKISTNLKIFILSWKKKIFEKKKFCIKKKILRVFLDFFINFFEIFRNFRNFFNDA